MNAKGTDLTRIQEIYDIVRTTRTQMAVIGFTRVRFISPQSAEDELIAEGITNRVLRATEEIAHLSKDIAQAYGFEQTLASGVRNRLAHAYGETNLEIIWDVVEHDFNELERACEQYCDERGLSLE